VLPCSGCLSDDCADVLINNAGSGSSEILATLRMRSYFKARDCGIVLRNLEMKVAALPAPFLGPAC